MKADNVLTVGYLEKHPEEAARLLETLPSSMSADLFGRLSPDNYIETFLRLLPSYAAALIDSMDEESRSELFKKVSNERLVILFRFFDESKRREIMIKIPSERKKRIVSQMQYPPNSVGSIMTMSPLSLPIDISTADALKRVRKSVEFHFPDIIVLDKELKYVGMVSLNKLLKSSPLTKVRTIVNYKVPSLSARKPLGKLTENPIWETVRVLPVTDGRGELIGALDYASLRQYSKATTLEFLPDEQVKQSSMLEVFFQVLATVVEGLVNMAIFHEKSRKRRE